MLKNSLTDYDKFFGIKISQSIAMSKLLKNFFILKTARMSQERREEYQDHIPTYKYNYVLAPGYSIVSYS